MPNKTSQDILPTAANLLGFSLFVITSVHVTNKATSSMIDEFASIIALILTFSCFFSFISIRKKDNDQSRWHETIAEYLFLFSIIGIVIMILLLVFGIIQ